MVKYNPNPCCIRASDCVVRAICAATGEGWYKVYTELCVRGAALCDMPSVNRVWASYLKERGDSMKRIAGACTVYDFAREHPDGIYILGTGTHAVSVIDGDYYDAFDSGNELVRYYFTLEDGK